MTRATLLLLLFPLTARAADPWHLKEWNARAVVEITKKSPDAGCDTAGVKVLCQGRVKADGADYRVVDAKGKAVPFQLCFHDAERYSLISFKADDLKGKYFIYFDNPKATKATEQVVVSSTPGSGPPKGTWVPKYGFVLQTIERPKGDNPRKVEELAKLIKDSNRVHGGRYQRRVSEGYNHFGPSDYYLSVYRGWVRVPKAGKYQFCTVSNEASFSFLDGKELIHWPGRHTVDRGIRGEVNALHDLKEGLHYLEYYHEEVTLDQMAFLGWRVGADAGAFSPIPESFFTAPHATIVKSYEGSKGPLVTFEPVVSDSVWLASRSEGQYTGVQFKAGVGLPAGTTYEWDFGDGQKATGAEARHIYLTLGSHTVTLTATSGKEKSTAKWPLLVFEIEHVTDQFKEGRPKDYVALVKKYDRAKLGAEALKELAYLYAESEEPAEAVKVGSEYVKRFAAKADALQVARVRRLIADCAIQQGTGKLDDAITNYRAALVKQMPATEKLEVLARLIRLVGVERKQPTKAVEILKEAEKIAKGEGVDSDGRKAFIRAVIAAGDTRLWEGKKTEALKLYQRAEDLNPKPIPKQVRAARLGAYPSSLREYIKAGNYGAALDMVDQWEDLFATDKINGHSLFWRGKVLTLRGQPRDAGMALQQGLKLGTGADWETEARWLLAGALETLGKKDLAKKELAKLVASGLSDEFVKKAKEKLAKELKK